MKQQVEVKVCGVQVVDGEEQRQEVNEKGEFYIKDGVAYLLYKEMEENKKTEVRTIVKDKGKKIEVVKNGFISVKMCFADGLSYNSQYNTPMGMVNLRTVTKEIKREDSKEGFTREMYYSVYMDDQYIGENMLGIYVKFV